MLAYVSCDSHIISTEMTEWPTVLMSHHNGLFERFLPQPACFLDDCIYIRLKKTSTLCSSKAKQNKINSINLNGKINMKKGEAKQRIQGRDLKPFSNANLLYNMTFS